MKSEKKLDAVKMMREIRDKLGKEFMNMNYEEQKRYIQERIKAKIKMAHESKQDVDIA